MILGKIYGKITTNSFKFLLEKEARKFEFVQVPHKVYDYVLCQIVEIERTDKDIAHCVVIGYKDKKGRIKPIRIPFEQDAEVLLAEDEFIKSIIKLEDPDKGALIGKLEGKDIKVHLDLKKLLTKHVAILAKSGAGKSYTVGVLIEEIIDKKVPILIIDPHGEYGSMTTPNTEEKDSLIKYGLKPQAFTNIHEYGDTKLNPRLKPLRLNNNLNPNEIVHLFPGKLSNTQMGLLYSALKHIDTINFTNVLLELEKEESNSKWTIINNLEHLNNIGIFSESFVPYNELIQPGKCSIINLKGIPPDVQEIIVYKIMKDLFEERKKEKIPPFFTVIEEAHNYCPERSFGETRSSKILRTVASEGRKFGLGLCVISQRPARVDKSVLSQCTTQIIMKVTNPNDLKAIYNSVEGLTSESQDEIKNLAIGSALVTGMVDMPLFVGIRPRMSRHGGQAQEILKSVQDEKFYEKDDKEESEDIFEQVDDFEEKELMPIVQPKITAKDIKLMSDKPVKEIHMTLVPGYLFICQDDGAEYNLLMDAVKGQVVTNVDTFETKSLPAMQELTPAQIKVLQAAYNLKSFSKEKLVQAGLPMDIDSQLQQLVKKQFLRTTDKGYEIADTYILSQLNKHACYHKIEFLHINYNDKLPIRKDIDALKEQLSKFTTIKDQRECHILRHDVIT